MNLRMIERIYCGVQNYAWGKVGATSTVAQLATKSAKNFRFFLIAENRSI